MDALGIRLLLASCIAKANRKQKQAESLTGGSSSHLPSRAFFSTNLCKAKDEEQEQNVHNIRDKIREEELYLVLPVLMERFHTGQITIRDSHGQSARVSEHMAEVKKEVRVIPLSSFVLSDDDRMRKAVSSKPHVLYVEGFEHQDDSSSEDDSPWHVHRL